MAVQIAMSQHRAHSRGEDVWLQRTERITKSYIKNLTSIEKSSWGVYVRHDSRNQKCSTGWAWFKRKKKSSSTAIIENTMYAHTDTLTVNWNTNAFNSKNQELSMSTGKTDSLTDTDFCISACQVMVFK